MMNRKKKEDCVFLVTVLFILGVICSLQLNFHNACDLIYQLRDGSGPNCSCVHLAACSCLVQDLGIIWPQSESDQLVHLLESESNTLMKLM